jgi:preprotein translocase subunit SecY
LREGIRGYQRFQMAKTGKYGDLRRRLVFSAARTWSSTASGRTSRAGHRSGAAEAAVQWPAGGILNLFNMFSGGALSRFTVFALGIMPYISASIIMQLMTYVVPTFEQ